MNTSKIVVANITFFLSVVIGALAYVLAFCFPRLAQRRVLLRIIAKVGKDEEWFRSQPVTRYEDYSHNIDLLTSGSSSTLGQEIIDRLVPTSGSSSGNKLIPYSKNLKRAFRRGIEPWIAGLYARFPPLFTSTQYWVVTPALSKSARSTSALPVGFEDDSEYVGGIQRWVLTKLWCGTQAARRSGSLDEFRYLTALALVAERDLGLVSAWSPTLFSLVLDEITRSFNDIVLDLTLIYKGQLPIRCNRAAAEELSGRPHRTDLDELSREVGSPQFFRKLWPKLAVVSVWADAFAREDAKKLMQRLPNVALQPKGLLATECFTTLPLGISSRLLAYNSHYFEFLDNKGMLRCHHELKPEQEYETVVTTQNGFIRYATGDRIVVDRLVFRRPVITFLGRSGTVDLTGEKLTDSFVEKCVKETFEEFKFAPEFWLCAPDLSGTSPCYTLFVSERPSPLLVEYVDKKLRRSFHYDHSRRMEQLGQVSVFVISDPDPASHYLAVAAEESNCRIGDIKPAKLSPRGNWHEHFSGYFI